MEIVQKIANSIDPMIKLTVETPCNFADGKLPVLDVTVNINYKEDNRIDFEFFEKPTKKPTKNPKVILANSALSISKKRTILKQEYLRRLRNTKKELGPEVQKIHLNNFRVKLKDSGYSQKFWTVGCRHLKKMLEEVKNGLKPLYRSRELNKEERQASKNKEGF